MTTNQLIALLFPIAAGVGAVATGWFALKFIAPRERRAEHDRGQAVAGTKASPEEIQSVLGELEKATNLIHQVEDRILKTGTL